MVYCRSGGGVVCVFKKRTAVRYYSSAQRDSARLSPLRELAHAKCFITISLLKYLELYRPSTRLK